MPAAESTLVNFPPQSECLVRGLSANDWNASSCSPHFAQRYTYVGMDAPSDGRRGLALDAYECQSYRAAAAAGSTCLPTRFSQVLLRCRLRLYGSTPRSA